MWQLRKQASQYKIIENAKSSTSKEVYLHFYWTNGQLPQACELRPNMKYLCRSQNEYTNVHQLINEKTDIRTKKKKAYVVRYILHADRYIHIYGKKLTTGFIPLNILQ